jgi:ECF transporter S component (folate family)
MNMKAMNQKGAKGFGVNQIVIMGLLVAMDVILARFLSINTPISRVGFAFVARVIAAVVLGPVQAAIVGACGDFVGAIVFPSGAYFPGFTLTAAMIGLIYGLFLHKKVTPVRIVAAVVTSQILCSLGLNTLWLSMITGTSFPVLLSTRLIQALVTGAVQIATIFVLQGAFLLIKRQVRTV